ncbi:YbjN domain-containing protein [Cupriavidus sp. DL-D2]|uniref:YbjN domain-containing protein n=1 Tax=Cupriavidus sp. DL-D2 TaxID=3144974 RepID=UPI0032129CEE
MTEAVLDIAASTEANLETNIATQPAVVPAVSAEQLAEAIRRAGCAVQVVEEEQGTRLHSASHGVGFQVLWGNRLGPDQYLDFTLSCPLRVDGGVFPDALLADWHRSRRFARIATHGDFVVLEMDVMVTGGVSEDFLSVSMQVWIQMMGQFFLHLRNFRAEGEGEAAETSDAAA